MCESVKVQLYRRLQWTGHAWHSSGTKMRWGILPLPGRGARARAVPVDGHETASGSVGAVASKNPGGQAWLLYGCDPDALLKELATRGLEPRRQQVVVIVLI